MSKTYDTTEFNEAHERGLDRSSPQQLRSLKALAMRRRDDCLRVKAKRTNGDYLLDSQIQYYNKMLAFIEKKLS